jgi:GAF domain-containing protein
LAEKAERKAMITILDSKEREGARVIVEDITQSDLFVGTPALDIQLAAGVRAVQSTPLIGRSGSVLGLVSTHFKAPHRPNEIT